MSKFEIISRPSVGPPEPIKVWLSYDTVGDLCVWFEDERGEDIVWAYWKEADSVWETVSELEE